MGIRTDAPLMQFKSILLKYSTPTYTGAQSEGQMPPAAEDTVTDRVEMSVSDKAEASGCRRWWLRGGSSQGSVWWPKSLYRCNPFLFLQFSDMRFKKKFKKHCFHSENWLFLTWLVWERCFLSFYYFKEKNLIKTFEAKFLTGLAWLTVHMSFLEMVRAILSLLWHQGLTWRLWLSGSRDAGEYHGPAPPLLSYLYWFVVVSPAYNIK